MEITYTCKRQFSQKQLEELFLAVHWDSGKYPTRLYKALQNYETVITAWEGQNLAGLLGAIGDGGMTAYIHYVLVHPAYQGKGIGKKLVGLAKERYKDNLCVVLIAEHSGLIDFYEKEDFVHSQDSAAMYIKKM